MPLRRRLALLLACALSSFASLAIIVATAAEADPRVGVLSGAMRPEEESDQLPEEGPGGQGADDDKSGATQSDENAGGSDQGDEDAGDATGNPDNAG